MRRRSSLPTPAGVKTRSSARNPSPPRRRHAATPPPPEPIDPQQKLHDDCLSVLTFMDSLGLDLGTLVHAIFYGNPLSRGNTRMRDARNTLYKQNRFSQFLANVYSPPRAPSGGGTVASAGRSVLLDFALKTVQQIFAKELADLTRVSHVDKATVSNWGLMRQNTSDALSKELQEICPHLWRVLVTLAGDWVPEKLELSSDAAGTDNNPEANLEGFKVAMKPHPHFGTILCISSLAFRLNRRNNKLQTMLAVYAHAKQTDKFVHNLLHQAGITMSYNWATDFVTALRDAKKQEAIVLAATKPILFVHDNIRMPFKVRSERGGHHSVTDNGTATTMIVLPEAARTFEDSDDFGPFFRRLKSLRINGNAPRLSWQDLMQPDRLKRVSTGYIFDCLDFLLMVPGMKNCKVFQSTKLKLDIDESTYSGNIQVIKAALNYLELLKDDETRNRLALERKIPWTGDQMTAQCCEMAQFFFNECHNPIDRLEPFIFYFALFHCEMALGSGTYEHSRGTSTGRATLARSALLLNQTGLQQNMNKTRPDFHKCDEALLHELEARIRGIFLVESGCKSDEELVAWVNAHTEDEVLQLATQVYLNHASANTLNKLQKSGSTDQARPSTILTNRDLLRYYSFRHAIKHRDINRVEDLLPELFIFFSGSGNCNYAKECYNFLQMLTHEVTPKLKESILKYGLLVNFQGRADSFYPIDQCQEHNNAGIRDYAPSGPSSTWTHIQKVSPVIPYYMDNVKFIEEQILGQTWSHIHKDPKCEQDVQALMRLHDAGNVHIETPGRSINKDDVVKDCIAAGTRALKDGKLKEYAEKRELYFNAISDEVSYSDSPSPSPPPSSPSNPTTS
ncbi:hypothetical protein FS749_007298 [Ceratobasidium sp. UAMH 11750]|nr:hypothetical protein FS749_007298 [Ceratobasidium sp. UAMH 11750]